MMNIEMARQDQVHQQVDRMPEGLIAVSPEKVAAGRAVQAVVQIFHLIKNAIAEREDRGLFVEEIVTRSGACLGAGAAVSGLPVPGSLVVWANDGIAADSRKIIRSKKKMTRYDTAPVEAIPEPI